MQINQIKKDALAHYDIMLIQIMDKESYANNS